MERKYTDEQLDEAFTKGYDAYESEELNPYDADTETELFEEWLDGHLFARQEEFQVFEDLK